MPLSKYVCSLKEEYKAQYFRKLERLGFSHDEDDPYLVEEMKATEQPGRWSTSVESWPEVEFGNIYVYLIDSPGYTLESLKTYKSLDAYKFFVNGWVSELYIRHNDTGHCIVRAHVKSSSSESNLDEPHQAWVGFKTDDGSVITGHCTCMSGPDPVCAHVGAILFQVEGVRHLRYKDGPGPSQPSLWNEQLFKVLLQDVASRAIRDMMEKDKHLSTVDAETRQQRDTSNSNTSCLKSQQSETDQEMEVKPDASSHIEDACLSATPKLQEVLSAPPAKPHHSMDLERSLKGLPSCRICNLTFTTNFFFESHMKRHHNEEYWKIMDEKKKKSNSTVSQKSSAKSSSPTGGGLFKCEECGNSYLKRRSLLRHMRIHSGEKPFKCDECDKGFSERHSLHNHKRTHTGEKPFKCTECGKDYRNGSSLYAHMRSHQGLRPYKCNECGKNFRTTTDINTHMRTHTGEKPFKCEVCGKDFTQRAHLNTHMLIHTGEKAFKCEECGQSFNRSGHLQRHMTKHTGERPFLCSLCGRGFSNSVVLRRHMKIHSHDRSAMCMQCGKTFRTSGDLRKHMRCHKTKPFSCQVCCKNFINSPSLIAHMKRHGIQEPPGREGTLEMKAL